jgi:hypothetical protein
LRLRYFITAFFLFAVLCCTSALATDKPSSESEMVHAGGLMCFTILPSAKPPAKTVSCDALCGARGAACTGLSDATQVTGLSCAEPGLSRICRCCAVTH